MKKTFKNIALTIALIAGTQAASAQQAAFKTRVQQIQDQLSRLDQNMKAFMVKICSSENAPSICGGKQSPPPEGSSNASPTDIAKAANLEYQYTLAVLESLHESQDQVVAQGEVDWSTYNQNAENITEAESITQQAMVLFGDSTCLLR